jgi:predicted aspartyl protease
MRHRGDRIPGRRGYGGVLLVPCLFHDAYRYWLLADTGAARTLITPDVALELNLDVRTPMRQERIASVHRIVSAPVVRLASVQIGAQRLTHVEAVVLPLPVELRVDGLLGVNVLEHFRTTFEFPQATIVLR